MKSAASLAHAVFASVNNSSRPYTENKNSDIVDKMRTQAAPLTVHCNVLHAADGTIPSLSGVMWVYSAFFVPGDLDLWPWHSNSFERGTKHVFPVNLAQIRSAVPEIFDSQTKKKTNHRALKQNLTVQFTACGNNTAGSVVFSARWISYQCLYIIDDSFVRPNGHTGHYNLLMWFIMAALRTYSRCGQSILPLRFLLSFFFPLLFSAVGDWIFTIYFHTWCCLIANLEYMSETCCTRLAENAGRKNDAKIAFCAPSHKFVELYLHN